METCIECGGNIANGQCEVCGLTPVAAELAVRRRILYSVAMFMLAAVGFLTTVAYYPPVRLDEMLIFLGLVFFTVMGLAVWLDFRARRRRMNQPIKRVFYGLVPVPWLLVALLFVNGRFDSSAVESFTTRVVGKFTMPGTLKNSRLVVVSWEMGRSVERIPISRDDYARFQKGDVVEVRVHSGLAGIPWVDSVYHKD
jgi:hypothetical protein